MLQTVATGGRSGHRAIARPDRCGVSSSFAKDRPGGAGSAGAVSQARLRQAVENVGQLLCGAVFGQDVTRSGVQAGLGLVVLSVGGHGDDRDELPARVGPESARSPPSRPWRASGSPWSPPLTPRTGLSRAAVTACCPSSTMSNAVRHGCGPTRDCARGSGTPRMSRLVIVAARASRVPVARWLSAMANTAA